MDRSYHPDLWFSRVRRDQNTFFIPGFSNFLRLCHVWGLKTTAVWFYSQTVNDFLLRMFSSHHCCLSLHRRLISQLDCRCKHTPSSLHPKRSQWPLFYFLLPVWARPWWWFGTEECLLSGKRFAFSKSKRIPVPSTVWARWIVMAFSASRD